jgi:hypothetical protein
MACLNCGADATVRAHLIPQTFVREVRGDAKGHALTNSELSSFQPSQNGRYDDAILCAACDNILGKEEKYASETLAAIRRSALHIVGRAFMVDGIEGDRLLRFAAGIAWKYSVTKPQYGGIALGPYSLILRDLLFRDAHTGEAVDAFLMKLHSGDDIAYFYRAPSLERYEGLNFVRFAVGGFIVLLKLDRRRPVRLPASAWLRGSSSILIPGMAFNEIEEGRKFLAARQGNAELDAYLQRVDLKAPVH